MYSVDGQPLELSRTPPVPEDVRKAESGLIDHVGCEENCFIRIIFMSLIKDQERFLLIKTRTC